MKRNHVPTIDPENLGVAMATGTRNLLRVLKAPAEQQETAERQLEREKQIREERREGRELIDRMLALPIRYLHEMEASQRETDEALRRENSIVAAAKLNAACEVIAAGAGLDHPEAVMKIVLRRAKAVGS